MFNNILSTLRNSDVSSAAVSRRQFSRRKIDKCVGVIDGKTYPVTNWSLGGVLICSDSRNFGVNDEKDITVKFKLRNEIINVPHRARVVRKSNNNVALEFAPLTRIVRDSLQSVVDDYVAGQFADSQLAS